MNQALKTQPRVTDFSSLLDDSSEPEAGIKVDIKRLIWGIWQQRLMIVGVTATTAIIALMLAMSMLQPTWTGRTTLLKKEQQDEFRVGRYGLPFKTQEYAFKTLLDTLMLPGTLESAMQQAGIRMPGHELARLVDVHVGKESKAFTISVKWSDPVMAAALTNSLAEVFIQRNKNMRRQEIESSLNSYRDRLASADAGSAQQADALLTFEASNDISDINTQLMVLLEKRQQLEVDLRSLDGDRFAAAEQGRRLLTQIDGEPNMIVQTSYFVNPLQKNLSQMEWELSQARGRYTDDNPKVKDLILRITKIQAMVDSGKDTSTPSETFAHNPVKQELTITHYESQAELLRLETRVERLSAMLIELTERINDLTRQRKSHEALSLKKTSAQGLQNDLRQRVDSLTVLLLGQVGDFELLERAAQPDQPERSVRSMLVIGLTLLGAMTAVAIALLREFFTPRIRTLKDLELCSGISLICEVNNADQPRVNLDAAVSPIAGQFRRFSNDLQQATHQRQLAFFSVESQAGTTTTAVNCALGMHMKGESISLVDADLRMTSQPIDIQHPNVVQQRSLSGWLTQTDTQTTSEPVPLVLNPHLGYLKITPARMPGDRQPMPEDVLMIGGREMSDTRVQLETHQDWTFYNLPAIDEQEAGFEALQQIGAAVLVVRSGQTRKADLSALLARLQRHDITVVAAVLCDVPDALMSDGQVLQSGDLRDDVRKLMLALQPAKLRSASGLA
jgi:capsular polysaccharide biosynthesis protein/Mrp family chromosome partitioning ATPase